MTAVNPTSPSTVLDRAAVIGRTARWRLREGKVAAAAALLDHALELCGRSEATCERLRLELLLARAECHEQAADHRAVTGDLAWAIELAERLGDRAAAATACSRMANALEAAGDGVRARFYAEHARTLFVSLEDWRAVNGVMTVLNRLPV